MGGSVVIGFFPIFVYLTMSALVVYFLLAFFFLVSWFFIVLYKDATVEV